MGSTGLGLNALLHHRPATQPHTLRRCSQQNSLISNPSDVFLFAILIWREIPEWRWFSVCLPTYIWRHQLHPN